MQRRYIVITFILFLFSCKNEGEKTKPTRQTITESVYASGYVKSENQYQVFSKASGTIQSIEIQKGDMIQQGQVLAKISNQTSLLNTENASLAAANADFGANQDKLNEVKLNIDLALKKMKNDSLVYFRQKKLWADEIGTHFELEQRELSYANSKSAYQSAILRYNDLQKQLKFASEQSKKNVSISKSMLADFDIRSEVSGRVYNILKEKGEMVSPQTPIAVIGDAKEFSLILQVDENDIVKVGVGQKILVTLDSYKGEVFEAKVTRVNPLMNERSRSFEVEANFTKKPDILYPNLTVEANIVLQSKENVLTIPRSFLLDDGSVMISKKDKKKIKTGLMDYQKVEVIEGLTENDEIFKPAK